MKHFLLSADQLQHAQHLCCPLFTKHTSTLSSDQGREHHSEAQHTLSLFTTPWNRCSTENTSASSLSCMCLLECTQHSFKANTLYSRCAMLPWGSSKHSLEAVYSNPRVYSKHPWQITTTRGHKESTQLLVAGKDQNTGKENNMKKVWTLTVNTHNTISFTQANPLACLSFSIALHLRVIKYSWSIRYEKVEVSVGR